MLSENNNNDMKKYLFEQGESGSINFVRQAVETINKIGQIKNIETRVPNLFELIIDFLNEVAQIPNI